MGGGRGGLARGAWAGGGGRGGRMLAAGCEDAGEERGTCARDLDAAGVGGGFFFQGEEHGRRGADDGAALEDDGGDAGFGVLAEAPDIATRGAGQHDELESFDVATPQFSL